MSFVTLEPFRSSTELPSQGVENTGRTAQCAEKVSRLVERRHSQLCVCLPFTMASKACLAAGRDGSAGSAGFHEPIFDTADGRD